jgi:Ser/Thr protein kinase RdoA (MazF antagonist)
MPTDNRQPFQSPPPASSWTLPKAGFAAIAEPAQQLRKPGLPVGVEDHEPLIAKPYRPGRWSDEQIHEEHRFCLELAAHELPVVAPLTNEEGASLFRHGDFRFALYPRKGGHAPELDDLDNLLIMGRLLGRLHRIGAVRPFRTACPRCAGFGRAAWP